jgi:hypothetical protein
MAGVTAVLGIVGAVVSAVGTIAAGNAAKASADYEAEQRRLQGKEEFAAQQRKMLESRKEGERLRSTVAARASSGGFRGSYDDTVADLMGDIEEESSYRERTDLAIGYEKKHGRDAQAVGLELSGDAAQKGSYFSAAGTFLKGVGSVVGKYSTTKPTYVGSYRYG